MKDYSDIHTFVVCAYKESEYLEDCIASLKAQTVLSGILMITSTPNAYISDIAARYGIELRVNPGESGIAQDWNFAISQCRTKYVTVAHQDDTYEPEYCRTMIMQLTKQKRPLIGFCNYGEIRNGRNVENGMLVRVKRLLLTPLRVPLFFSSRLVRRRILGMGNAICCPSVTYCLEQLEQPVFCEGLKSNLDWETWERLSRQKGEFVYVSRVLMHHRIHEGSTTTEIIHAAQRGLEDYTMFRKFWPAPIAKLLTKLYSSSEKYNEVANK